MQHALISTGLGIGVFAVTGSPTAATCWAGGVLIDVDHCLDCLVNAGWPFRWRELWANRHYLNEDARGIVLLHSYEWLIPLWLLAGRLDQITPAFGLTVGFVGHLLTDQVTNHAPPLGYFFLWRWRHGFRRMWRFDPICRWWPQTDLDLVGLSWVGVPILLGILLLRVSKQMALTELCWIVSEQWPVNLELRGRAFDAAGIQEGIAVMRYIFRPYLLLD